MPSSQSLRDFIKDRLTAAADEIFSEFDKTIVQYEEELDRQRRLLEICWKPRINLQRIGIRDLHQNVKREEDVVTDQQFCYHERDVMLDQGDPESQLMINQRGEPEPLPVKEEQVELYISLNEKQLELQLGTDYSTVNHPSEERDLREPEPSLAQLPVQIISELEKQNQERIHRDSGSCRDKEQKQIERPKNTRSKSERVVRPEVKTQKKTQKKENLCRCKLCDKKISHRWLNSHMKIHKGDTPFSCITCGKGFRIRFNFIQHMRTHTGEKPFSCIVCEKSFSLRPNLLRHMKTHTGEKPFSCITCGRRFTQKEHLSQHMKTHTGEKPFLCITCGKSFSRRDHLSQHSKTHTDERPFPCITCGKSFKQRVHLSQHMRTHTDEKSLSRMIFIKEVS